MFDVTINILTAIQEGLWIFTDKIKGSFTQSLLTVILVYFEKYFNVVYIYGHERWQPET